MPGQNSIGTNITAIYESQSSGCMGTTSKSSPGMTFTGPIMSNLVFGCNLNASFRNPVFSKTAKLENVSQDFNSFGLVCKYKCSVVDEHQAEMRRKARNIQQSFQEIITTINEGMGELPIIKML